MQASEKGFVAYVGARTARRGCARSRSACAPATGIVEILSGVKAGRDGGGRGLRPAGRRHRRAGRAARRRRRRPRARRRRATRPVSERRAEATEPRRRTRSRSPPACTLADISIRNHVFAWMLMAALIGFGLLCFTGFGGVVKGLGISQNPDVDFPVVNVSVTYEGASPEIMETDVVDSIEDAVTSVEGVKQISSTSRQGSANITVEFELVAQHRRRPAGRADPRGPGRAPPAARDRPADHHQEQPRGPARSCGCRISGNRSPDLHGRLRAQRDPARSSRRSRAWARSSSAATASATSASGSTRARLEAQGLTVQDVIDAIAARAPGGAGRPHRDRRSAR